MGIVHHAGSFLLFAATILLIITDISSPVVNRISLLRVDLANGTSEHDTALTFGTFGHCIINTPGDGNDNDDYCSRTAIGYNPAEIVSSVIGNVDYSSAAENSAKGLTRVMVLHPIATGVAFLGFLLAVGSGFIGSFLGSVVSLIAFAITLVVMITDFVAFAIVRDKVNDVGRSGNTDSRFRDGDDDDEGGLRAHFGVAIWTILAAAICLLLGSLFIFLSCCSARRHRHAVTAQKVDGPYRAGWRQKLRY